MKYLVSISANGDLRLRWTSITVELGPDSIDQNAHFG